MEILNGRTKNAKDMLRKQSVNMDEEFLHTHLVNMSRTGSASDSARDGRGARQGKKTGAKKGKDSGGSQHMFPLRSELGIIDSLRIQLRELKAENHTLKEQNKELTNKLGIREEQLRDATDLLTLQRSAWQGAQRIAQSRPSTADGRENDARQSDGGVRDAAAQQQQQQQQQPPAPSASSRPQSAAPQSRRPLSAKPVASSALTPPLLPSAGPDHQQQQQQQHQQRPLTARNASDTPRNLPPRPNTARPSIGNLQQDAKPRPTPPLVPRENVTFSKFKDGASDADDQLKWGSFAARAVLSGAEAKSTINSMSEQSASFESLGVFLQCAWSEVKNATASEPAPNFFRLAVACSILDKVCGVVGAYAPLLLDIRREIYGCLFKGFDPASAKALSLEEYAEMLPYFAEFKRLENERTNHKRALDRLALLHKAATQRKRFDALM